ncbi:EGF-like domain-containing protein 2 [Gigantopelta aegis]|uniref:EGF-like domain-containing protein 2 n=1 Tax=Gigantopelta aegis TaxID=1735272 RepID=UPI001B8874A4|nr:EGF-like domain-containing protein 2 [Gigantopelta aegis]XP_041371997.1 EGF-like domain-containing protein 2 [Gigantopelta aegis]XP_041371998.1 EGF-like domain-containing protein 2 [Gigantopelta aegis]
MKNYLFRLNLFIAVLTGIQCGPFHCTRSSQPCPTDATCVRSNGTCQCPSPLQGDDCSIHADRITNTNCMCKNGGVCVRKDNDVVCACSVFYYGSDCSEKRYRVKCSTDEIIFNINPVGNFSGYASVKDENKPECRSTPVPSPPVGGDGIPDTWEGHVLRLIFNSSTCGKIEKVDKDNTTATYTVSVIVNFQKFDVKDEFVGVCDVKYQSYVNVTANIGVENESKTTETTTTEKYSSLGARTVHVWAISCVLAALTTWLNHGPS